MDSLELKSQGCGTLQDVNKCPSIEVRLHWEFPIFSGPGQDFYNPAAVERLNRICDACEDYTPRKS